MSASQGDPHRFEFDLDRGISEQVIEKLEASPEKPLIKDIGPEASGVYALYHKQKLVYVGKASKELTKSGRTLQKRLNEHVKKVEGRRSIALADVTCRYLTFQSEWWVIAAEHALITNYKPEWNSSGFGSKTPGRGRPGTERVSTWDKSFPPKASG